MTIESDLRKIENMGLRLRVIFQALSRFETTRVNFTYIVSNESGRKRYHTHFNQLARDKLLVSQFLDRYRILVRTNPQEALSFVRMHSHDLQRVILRYKRHLYVTFRASTMRGGKQEIDEINRCIADIEQWPTYRLTDRIDHFTNRLRLYTQGGSSDDQQFLGLGAHFKDVELSRKIMKSRSLRNLYTYRQQMEFFSWARAVIRKALQNPHWEGFLGKNGFYANLKGGRNYIKTVRETWGNEEMASFLDKLDHKIHQDPQRWEDELAEISHRLHDRSYQNQQVINPASQELLTILRDRSQDILKEQPDPKTPLRVLTSVDKEITRLTNAARQDINNLRKEFEQEERELALAMSQHVPQIIDILAKAGIIDPTKGESHIRSLNHVELWLQRFRYNFRRGSNPGVTLHDASKLDSSIAEIHNIAFQPLLGPREEKELSDFEANLARDVVPKMDRLKRYITSHDDKFRIKVSAYPDLLPEIKTKQ